LKEKEQEEKLFKNIIEQFSPILQQCSNSPLGANDRFKKPEGVMAIHLTAFPNSGNGKFLSRLRFQLASFFTVK
jgi:hypothetical protein